MHGSASVSTNSPSSAGRARMETTDERNRKYQRVAHSHQCLDVPIDDSRRRIKRSRPANRPGFNSYLKVILDDTSMNILHQMSLNIQNEVQQRAGNSSEANLESLAEKVEQAVPDTAPQSLSRGKDSAPLKYRPRARISLHMTLFFGGETLCTLPKDELQNWHARISERLERSGFFLQGRSQERESVDQSVSHAFGFRVSGLKVFPPQRNNLVVATLEPKDEWHDLHRDLREIAKDESCSPELASIVSCSKETWIAHVTLGNLIGGAKNDRKQLDTLLLNDVFDATLASLPMNGDTFAATTQGIGMGGPIPAQLELDWDFHFCPTNARKMS